MFNAIKNADAKIWPYVLFAICEIAAMMLAVIFMNKTFIVIFQIAGICVTLVGDSMVEGLRGSSIRDAKLDDFMPQAMAVGEVWLNLGRVIGFVCLMLIGIFNSFVATILLSSLFSLWLVAYFVFLGILKRYQKNFLEKEGKLQEAKQIFGGK